MKRQNYKDRLAEAEGKKKSMVKKTQTTKDRLDEAEPKKRKTHRMKDGTLHTGATHTKNSKVVKEPKKMKKQTTKDRLAEAEGKKKSMVKKTQTTKDRLDEAEPNETIKIGKETITFKKGGLHDSLKVPNTYKFSKDQIERYAKKEVGSSIRINKNTIVITKKIAKQIDLAKTLMGFKKKGSKK